MYVAVFFVSSINPFYLINLSNLAMASCGGLEAYLGNLQLELSIVVKCKNSLNSNLYCTMLQKNSLLLISMEKGFEL